jgi:hypothetical protein
MVIGAREAGSGMGHAGSAVGGGDTPLVVHRITSLSRCVLGQANVSVKPGQAHSIMA